MRVRDLLCSKAVTLCFLGLGGLLAGAFLAFADVCAEMIGMLELLLLLLVSGWLLVSFLVERRRFDRIEKLCRELPDKYLLGEILPAPYGMTERQYYRIMKEVSRSAVGLAEQAMREKEEYCSYVESWIHEIKTPLTACSLICANYENRHTLAAAEAEVEGPAEEAGMYGGMPAESDTAAGEEIRKLKCELKRADNLTESILYYARLRTAEKDTQIRRVRLAEIVDEAVRSQMELLIAAGISIETEGDFQAHTDEKALCFILKQLLVNCGKYCPGCHVDITIGEGKISVRDNGIGIPSHELRRVTERGFTGTNGRRLGNSTGMGLYLADAMCQRLGMELHIESEEGQFTEIVISGIK